MNIALSTSFHSYQCTFSVYAEVNDLRVSLELQSSEVSHNFTFLWVLIT